MRATRAHYRRTRRNCVIKFNSRRNFSVERLRDLTLRKFINAGQNVASRNFQAESFNVTFYHVVEFFNHEKFFDLRGKIFYKLDGQRVSHSEFENARRISENFLDVLIATRRGYNSNFVGRKFYAVYRRFFRILNQFFCAFLDNRMAFFCVAWHHYIFCNIFFVNFFMLLAFRSFHDGLRMCNAGTHFY